MIDSAAEQLVPRKKKPKAFRAVKAVKELARERIGAPRPQSFVPDKRSKMKSSEKHKPTLRELLNESE